MKETVREYLEELRDRSNKVDEEAAAADAATAAANTPVDDTTNK